jgi:nucleotide-binding universal stress UspA family protein
MIQKILFPTDLPVNPRTLVSYAFSLAHRNSAQLVVLHVRSFPSIWDYRCELDVHSDWAKVASKFSIDRVLAEGEGRLKNFVRQRLRAEADGVVWKARVTLGRVADEIITTALQEEVDLIVMERRRRSLLPRSFTRSIWERVSREAPCPVLSIDVIKTINRSGGWRLLALETLPSY